MRDLLSRGIGVHHGGLLPIVKEVDTLSPHELSKGLIGCDRLWRFYLLVVWSKYCLQQRPLLWHVSTFCVWYYSADRSLGGEHACQKCCFLWYP